MAPSCSKVILNSITNPLVFFSLSLIIFNLVDCRRESVDFENGKSPVSTRDPKLMYLPFLKVVIPPEPCGEENNGVRGGVCLPVGKCGKFHGVASGTCSYGFGECCTISTNCSSERKVVDVTQYVTTLKTPINDPTTPCSFRIKKQPDVCQIRLDFQTFLTAKANENGECVKDRLQISNSRTVIQGFTTCGNLGQQHMYLTFGSSDSIDLSPVLTEATSQYSIVVTQIPCFSKRVVPSHCLQYYNKTTDTVRSLGYNGVLGQQQSNQKYTICVEAPEQSRSITWRPCAETTRPFYISDGVSPDTSCPRDWIQINGELKRCGDTFPTMVSSPWTPYTINVNFDKDEIPQLPFPMVPERVNSAGECSLVAANSGGLLTCDYIGTSCTCTYTVNLQGLFGSPDISNTGFCLVYQV